MIKKLLVTLTIILSSLHSFSQEKNELRVYTGTSDSKLLRNKDLNGAGSEEVKDQAEMGIRYLRKISGNLALEVGLNYSKADIEISPAFMGQPVQARGEEFKLLSVPVYANYTVWNYFFINGGPMIDFQLSDNTTDSQSGLGYGIGLGGKYGFDNWHLYLNPGFKRHAVLPFEKNNFHQKLTELGVQFGLGFIF